MIKKLGRWFKDFGRWLQAPDNLPQGFLEVTGALSAKVIRANGEVEHVGVISRKKVTTVFVNALVDTLQSSVSSFSDFKYHDSGEGVTGESNSDTALGSPCGVARVTGSQIEGASANIYKSVGTITYDGSYAVTEHGLFNQSSGGTLMDRSVFSAINVVNNDQIEFTYELTANAEA